MSSNHFLGISPVLPTYNEHPSLPHRPVKIGVQTLEGARDFREEWAATFGGFIPITELLGEGHHSAPECPGNSGPIYDVHVIWKTLMIIRVLV